MRIILPPVPPGFFQLTTWRPLRDMEAKAIRDGWVKSLGAQGIKTLEQEFGGKVALYREGEELRSGATIRWQDCQARKKIKQGSNVTR